MFGWSFKYSKSKWKFDSQNFYFKYHFGHSKSRLNLSVCLNRVVFLNLHLPPHIVTNHYQGERD
jgi:hypothetical protein